MTSIPLVWSVRRISSPAHSLSPPPSPLRHFLFDPDGLPVREQEGSERSEKESDHEEISEEEKERLTSEPNSSRGRVSGRVSERGTNDDKGTQDASSSRKKVCGRKKERHTKHAPLDLIDSSIQICPKKQSFSSYMCLYG